MVEHPVVLRGLTFDRKTGRPAPSAGERPVIVERTDEDFLAAFLAELRTDAGRAKLADDVTNAGEPASKLKLYQPVHRTFYLVVLEALCETFGEPRLDPRRIESAGLCVRRLLTSGKREGWMRKGGVSAGWREITDPARDPDPARLPDPAGAGPAALRDHLRAALGAEEPYEETITRLFVAPPDVCAAAGRTILYGLVPLSGAEASPSGAPRPRYDASEIEGQLSPWFVASPASPSLAGVAGKKLTAKWREESAALGASAQANLDHFVTMLRALISVFNAFEHSSMRAALDAVSLEYDEAPKARPAGKTLAAAADVLVHGKAGSFTVPARWPKLTSAQAAAIARAASAASDERIKAIVPRQGRFGATAARHEIHAFVRVRRDDGCPPKIVWTERPSQPFEIAAWYENGKLPPVEVALPPVTAKNAKDFLPNVTFRVPQNIFDLLGKNDLKGLIDGAGKEGQDGGVGWLCGFNIPIITLCAFLVLSIFLALLNIIFFWIAFVKICIPVPKALVEKK